MKVLVIGSGGREHALAWKINQSPLVEKLYAAPGSDIIAEFATCVDIKANDVDALAEFAKKEGIELTMVGPEDPLTLGVVDKFKENGLLAVGPTREAAQMEGSKIFSKELMKKYGIPTADFYSCSTRDEALNAVEKLGLPVVVKADGLAAGKGVILCDTIEEATEAIDAVMVEKRFGSSGEKVVIEKLLSGEEASFIVLTDGKTVLPMASSQDHKRALDDDKGLNTGGMGAYSPAPVVDETMHNRIMNDVMLPTIKALEAEGTPFAGVLYAGVMINDGVPYVLEFNCRFGDPETQPIMARLKSDIVPLLKASAEGNLDKFAAEWDERTAVCVVMASGGYPESYEKGFVISGLDEAAKMEDVVVFHAGTKLVDGNWTNQGGRVLGVTALGNGVKQAVEKSYRAVKAINWEKVHYRGDIAKRALNRL